MKILNLVTIFGILILVIAGVVIAEDVLTPPTPKYTILETYMLDFDDHYVTCLIIEGYNGTDPCFNSTEFTSATDTQSLINLHDRISDIDDAKQETADCARDERLCGDYVDRSDEENWYNQLNNTLPGTTR